MASTIQLTAGNKIYVVQDQVWWVNTAQTATVAITSGPISNANVRRIFGSVWSSHAGTLTFKFSDDGTHWKAFGTTVSVTATTFATFTQTIYAGLTMLSYVGTGNASTFRLAAYTYPY